LWSAATAPAAGPLDAVMARIDTAAKSFHGLSADVRWQTHTYVIHQDTIDEGTIQIRRTGVHDVSVLLDFTKPSTKTIAYSKNKAEIYYPQDNRIEVYDTGKRRDLLEQFLLLGFGTSAADLKSAYTITGGVPDTVGGKPTVKLELVPRSEAAKEYLKKAELWVDETGISVQQKLYTGGGDYKLATYTNLKLVPKPPKAPLKLTAPKDAKREYPLK
jgi:outer membrane lipoprotein-sorting protein